MCKVSEEVRRYKIIDTGIPYNESKQEYSATSFKTSGGIVISDYDTNAYITRCQDFSNLLIFLSLLKAQLRLMEEI